MSTKYQQTEWRNNRRERLRKEGLCRDCATNPVGRNLNGTKSVRCETCKLPVAKQRHAVTAASLKDSGYKRPPRDDWGVNDYDFRDLPEFKTLRRFVFAIIANHGPLTSREIKEHLGERHDPRNGRTEAALDDLTGEIETVQRGAMFVYVTAGSRHSADAMTYAANNAPAPRSSRVEPYALLDGAKPNVTA